MEAAAQGYEMRGLISLLRPSLAAAFVGDETTALMERPVGESARRYEYKLVSSTREKREVWAFRAGQWCAARCALPSLEL